MRLLLSVCYFLYEVKIYHLYASELYIILKTLEFCLHQLRVVLLLKVLTFEFDHVEGGLIVLDSDLTIQRGKLNYLHGTLVYRS